MSCHITWCRAPHTKPGTEHFHAGDAVPIGSSLTVRRMLNEWPGDLPDEPWVQLAYSVDGRERQLYVTPQGAADWSELLAGLDVRDLAAFAQALYRTAVSLGAGP